MNGLAELLELQLVGAFLEIRQFDCAVVTCLSPGDDLYLVEEIFKHDRSAARSGGPGLDQRECLPRFLREYCSWELQCLSLDNIHLTRIGQEIS